MLDAKDPMKVGILSRLVKLILLTLVTLVSVSAVFASDQPLKVAVSLC